MVSGISSNGGSSSLFSGSSFREEGFFSVSDDNPRNILQLDPAFKEPSAELREAEEIRREKNEVREEQPENSLSGQVLAEPSIGNQSVRRLAAEQSDPINIGGSAVEVTGGSVSFESGDQSVNVGEDDEARILENDDGSVTLVNRSTDQRVTFNQGDQIDVSGEGTAEIFGTDRTTVEGGGAEAEQIRSETITVSDGSTLDVSRTNTGNTALSQPDSADSIELGDQTDINVSGDTGERFTFTNNRGRSISFEAGEAGSLTRNDNGLITIENEGTGETETFSTDRSLSTGGNARASLTTPGRDTLVFEGRDQGQFVSGNDGQLELINQSTVDQTEVDARRDPPLGEGSVRIQTFDDPAANARSFLQQQLLGPPEESNQNETAEEAEKSEEEAEEAEEAEKSEEDTSQNARSLEQDELDEEQAATRAASFQDDENAGETAGGSNEEQNLFTVNETQSDETNVVAPGESEEDDQPFPINDSDEDQVPGVGNEEDNDSSAVTNNAETDNVLTEQDQLRRQFSAGQNRRQTGQQLNFRA